MTLPNDAGGGLAGRVIAIAGHPITIGLYNPKLRGETMSNWKWVTDSQTGDLVITVDGRDRGRIPNPDHLRMDQGKPGGSIFGVEDLQREYERVLGCKSNTEKEN